MNNQKVWTFKNVPIHLQDVFLKCIRAYVNKYGYITEYVVSLCSYTSLYLLILQGATVATQVPSVLLETSGAAYQYSSSLTTDGPTLKKLLNVRYLETLGSYGWNLVSPPALDYQQPRVALRKCIWFHTFIRIKNYIQPEKVKFFQPYLLVSSFQYDSFENWSWKATLHRF